MRWGLLWSAVIAAIMVSVSGCKEKPVSVEPYKASLQKDASDLAFQYMLCRNVLNTDDESEVVVTGNMAVALVTGSYLKVSEESTDHAELTRYLGQMIYSVETQAVEIVSVTIDDIYAVSNADYPCEAVVTVTYSLLKSEQELAGQVLGIIAADDQQMGSASIKAKLEEAWKNFQNGDQKIDLAFALKKLAGGTRETCTAVFDVRYDAAANCWIFDDSRLSQGHAVPEVSDWLAMEFNEATMLEKFQVVNGVIIPIESMELLKNYDNNLRLRNGNYLTLEQARIYDKSMEILEKLDSTIVSVDVWENILTEMSQLDGKIFDLENVYAKFVSNVRGTINKWRKEQNTTMLAKLKNSIKNNASLWDPVKEKLEVLCVEALEEIVRGRENNLRTIRDEFEKMSLANGSDLRAMLNSMVSLRKKINYDFPHEDARSMEAKLLHIVYCKLLLARNTEAVSELYAMKNYGETLRPLEEDLLAPCQQCRNSGRQICIYCREQPGRCSKCKGKRFVDGGEVCEDCHGNGICSSCDGKRKIVCMSCRGMKLQIVDQKVNEFLQQNISEGLQIIDAELSEIVSLRTL